MKNWIEADIAELDLNETAKTSHGNGNTAGGPDGGGNGNGKKLNQNWTEAQKDGNTTFWGGPTDFGSDPTGFGSGYNGVNFNS